jgi:hypothetical protein
MDRASERGATAAEIRRMVGVVDDAVASDIMRTDASGGGPDDTLAASRTVWSMQCTIDIAIVDAAPMADGAVRRFLTLASHCG